MTSALRATSTRRAASRSRDRSPRHRPWAATAPINVEPLGSYRLPHRTVADLRVFKTFRFGDVEASRSSVDFSNLSNENTEWDARTLGGTINLRQNGDPNGTINTVPQFGSPAQVYGPRNIRFNVAYRF